MEFLTITNKLRQAFQDVARVIEGSDERLSVQQLMQACSATTPSSLGTTYLSAFFTDFRHATLHGLLCARSTQRWFPV